MRLMLLLAVCLLFFSLPAGAVVEGTVYDADTLDLAQKAIVSVNTVPEQLMVAQDGSYSFEIPAGNYTITAKKYEGEAVSLEASENLTIVDNGTYVLDLLLFPQTEFFSPDGGNRSIEEVEYEPIAQPPAAAELQTGQDQYGQQDYLQTAFAVLLLSALAYFIWKKSDQGGTRGPAAPAPKSRQKKKDGKGRLLVLSPEQKQAVGILKKAGGFLTQKELRKAMPYSEAKVSLVVTELEEIGLAKRFKRGRGNIIKLLKG